MSNYWVKASLPPLLGPLPAWVVLPVPYLLISFGMTSVSLTLFFFVLGGYLTSKGRTLSWTVRRTRTYFRGHKMDARPLGYRRATNMDVAMHDFDFDGWRSL